MNESSKWLPLSPIGLRAYFKTFIANPPRLGRISPERADRFFFSSHFHSKLLVVFRASIILIRRADSSTRSDFSLNLRRTFPFDKQTLNAEQKFLEKVAAHARPLHSETLQIKRNVIAYVVVLYNVKMRHACTNNLTDEKKRNFSRRDEKYVLDRHTFFSRNLFSRFPEYKYSKFPST